MELLNVKDLKTYFHTQNGIAKAVDGVSFQLEKGKILGIVGESGSGKSVTSLSIMRLLDPVSSEIANGEILYEGQDLLKLSDKKMRQIRGNRISMIFQEPMTSLNPVFTIGYQIEEALRLHMGFNKVKARERSIELLNLVGIPEAEKRIDAYPHQLSGGMRQRVMIAMALSCEPELLIADEPTTALDVTIQAQILELLKELRNRLGMAIIIITHDLGVVAEVADDVVVMYAGEVVEKASVKDLFTSPKHPYSEGLMGSIPDINSDVERLQTMEGIVPSLFEMPTGCRFAPRCPYYTKECDKAIKLTKVGTREIRCRRYEDG